MSEPIEVEALQKVNLAPGDVLVLRLEGALSSDMVSRIQEEFRRTFPDHKAIVLGPGCKMEIVEGGGMQEGYEEQAAVDRIAEDS